LAWTCRELYADEPIGIAALRAADEQRVFHTFATWNDWPFDHCGWHRANDLISVNQDFVGYPLVRVEVTPDLAEFCREHYHGHVPWTTSGASNHLGHGERRRFSLSAGERSARIAADEDAGLVQTGFPRWSRCAAVAETVDGNRAGRVLCVHATETPRRLGKP